MNPWLSHLKAFYAKNKSRMSYSQAMKAAKATYKKVGKAKGKKKSSKK
jgi:hypothetical protein